MGLIPAASATASVPKYCLDKLSNELLYLYPDKAIFIARESNGSYKCSLRDNNRNIRAILEETLNEVGGDGGGHEHACGAIIPEHSFETFLEVDVFQLDIRNPVNLIAGQKFIVKKGLRIAQMVLCPVIKAILKEVDVLENTKRGSGGFGSTGIK